MQKTKFNKAMSMLISIMMILMILPQMDYSVYATQSRIENYSRDYSLTGNGATDMISVGMAQKGKTKSQLGYTEAWCADFVSDCAILANQTSAIPFNANVGALHDAVINKAGGHEVSSPQGGDLVCYYCHSCDRYVHVGLMVDSTNSIQGNYSSKVTYVTNPQYYSDSNKHTCSSGTIECVFVRPNYIGGKWYEGLEPQNLGDKFTAYIINTNAWKLLTTESDGNVLMKTETKIAEQMWQFTRKGDGSYKIINCKTGLALDSGGTDENLYTFTDCDNSYQSWYIFGSAGEYFLTSQATNGVIDIAGASTEDGTNAQLYECNGTTAQKFSIWKLSDGTELGTIQDLGDSFTAYIINTNAWKCLTAKEDGNVVQHTDEKKAEQLWQFTKKADGSYKIINCKTGLALDSGGTNDNLYTFTDCDNEYQSWYIFGSESSYMFTSQATNGVIDIAGASTEEGVNAQLYECNGTGAQGFEIIIVDSGKHLTHIQDIGSDFYAELSDGKSLFSDSRDGLDMKSEEGSSNQLWHFTQLNDGSYKIINCWSGKAFDSGGTDNSVYTYMDCDNSYQSWYIFGEENKYYLKSRAFDTVITITDNSAVMDKCNGSVSQQLSIKVLDIPAIEGDANLDGEVNVADVVHYQY